MKQNYNAAPKNCWILVEDGLKGTENQAIGVAQQLNIPFEVKNFSLSQPWKTFAPYLSWSIEHGIKPKITPPWPDLIIAAGRKAIAPALWLKKQSNAFTVFLQNPKFSSHKFDLIAAPAHDQLAAGNAIQTIGAPNLISSSLLSQAAQQFPLLAGKQVAVLIGGNSNTHKMDSQTTKKLAEDLLALDTSLMITTSRRTGEENERILKHYFDKEKHYFWDGKDNNPIHAMLAHAQAIIVTSDSASMISESCSTGKPVYIYPIQGSSPKFERFYNAIYNGHYAQEFSGRIESWAPNHLNDAETIATAIKERYVTRR